MAGKRLVDLALVFNASKTIVKYHIKLRSQQLDNYNKTSTLAKAVKNQTDRVTLTVKAAAALASRFNESAYSPTSQYAQAHRTQDEHTSAKSDHTAQPSVGDEVESGHGLEQDHHYTRPEHNAPIQGGLGEGLKVQQERPSRLPTPDGSIPPNSAPIDTGEVNDDVFSRRGGYQPVEQVTPTQPAGASTHLEPVVSDESTIPDPNEGLGSSRTKKRNESGTETHIPNKTGARPSSDSARSTAGNDSFYQRAQEAPSYLPSLPSSKIPKETKRGPDDSSNNAGRDLNADVFSSTNKDAKVQAKSLIDEDEIPEGIDINVFRSAKAARLLTGHMKEPIGSAKQNVEIKQESKEALQSRNSNIGRETAGSQGITSEINANHSDVAQDIHPMRESRVPSSRIGRLWEYGGLATSMALGAVGEGFRRATGAGTSGGNIMLSAGNVEMLVAKLSRMRGAALKLGQMMSFQDSKMLPGPIHEVLLRVQDHADYMPPSQRDRVLSDNLGSDWRSLFSTFDELPIAAASIGQVHRARLAEDGTEVAVKVQYPGVANSISSDLSNLSILLTASRLLPKGLYLDKTIANARIELAWECDYIREAECQTRFQKLISDESDTFTVPSVIPAASGKQVLTAELMHGVAVTKPSLQLTQEQRDWIGSNILRLCLRELVDFKFMQTDPNWTNFLFNPNKQKIELLDFGASREYPDKFVGPYIGILVAASKGDRETIRDLSIQLGYLTGHESQAMVNAHVTSVLTLAEPFRETQTPDEIYDFRNQTITDRVRGLIPVMVRERLAPPPEETYSLHRKLSGAFLLLAKLGSRVECRRLFSEAIEKWEIRGGLRVAP